MARGKERFSALECGRLANRVGKWHDGGGLYLSVRHPSKNGKPDPASGAPKPASWVFRYMADGKARTMGLGPYPAISLAEARKQAAAARTTRALGKDPLGEKMASRAAARSAAAKAVTFKAAATQYIKANRAGWKNEKHAAQWTSTLETYVYPLVGSLPVQAIDTARVTQVLEQELEGKSLWEARPETASRLRGRIESVLDWAKVRGHRQGENPARWKGHLDQAFPPRSKVRQIKHHEAIEIDNIAPFMVALRSQEGAAARALEFAILTAGRTGEIIGATWGEIDMAGKLWTIPKERMKASREHRVPLPDRAVSILKALRPADGAETNAGSFVFSGQKVGRPLSNMALLMLLRRMGKANLTAHGFRSTFRDWAAERTSFPSEAVEMALAHTVPNKVEAAYRRGDLFDRRRAIMDAWATFCDQPAGS